MFDNGLEVGHYHLFLIGVVITLTALLTQPIGCTCSGAQMRASVDNQQASAELGINVSLVSSATSALSPGLVGLGGGLGIDVLGPDPVFPTKYMVYFLLVVAVGGAGSIKGTLLAVLILGVSDIVGKYHMPGVGTFVICGLMTMLLVLSPDDLSGRRA